jgi:hypothetical protein
VARERVADRERPAQPARRRGCAVVACVDDVVRIAARKQDDITVTHALDMGDTINPEQDLALVNDVQRADAGEAHRERPQRAVRDDPFAVEADALQQFREQVARLIIPGQAGRAMIGKVLRRLRQPGWRHWTIGKDLRWNGHSCHPFLRLRSMIST